VYDINWVKNINLNQIKTFGISIQLPKIFKQINENLILINESLKGNNIPHILYKMLGLRTEPNTARL
jgi:uncharacterized membrane protein